MDHNIEAKLTIHIPGTAACMAAALRRRPKRPFHSSAFWTRPGFFPATPDTAERTRLNDSGVISR